MYILMKGLKTSKYIHSAVISNLLKASYTKFYNTILIGRLMNRLSKDIYNIGKYKKYSQIYCFRMKYTI